MGVHVQWAKGGQATLVSIAGAGAGDLLSLRSSVSSPPGSRIEGVLVGEPPARLRVKVLGCRRQAEGDFLLDVRSLDMTRTVRERLQALLPVTRSV